MHPLFTSSFKKNILSILFIIAIPAIILLAYVEIGLNNLDTHYLKKRIDFERQLNSIEVLSLGSSNAYYGINPTEFSCQGFNLAFNAQSMFYDLEFIKKYLPVMPNLKVVILPAIFYTTGTKLVGTSQDWRMYFYAQYYGLSNELENNNITDNVKRSIDSRNYSKIALYSDTLYAHVKNGFSGHVDYIPESNGWYNSKDVPRLNSENNVAVSGAAAHSASYDLKIASRNTVYWQEIIDILKKKNIQVILVRLPEDISITSKLDKNKVAHFTSLMTQLASKNNIPFIDYSQDQRFNSSDYTFMPDHLNPDGAKKFSAIFDEEILKSKCNAGGLRN